MRHTSHFGLGLIAALCLSASYGAALAATSSGIDTPTGQTTLPIAVEGVAGMTLVNQNVATPASGPVYVGIGTTAPLSSLQIGAVTELFSPVGSDSALSNNLYLNGAWKYAASGLGSAIYQDAGAISFYSAASGAEGAAATLTNTMEILANGDVGIGTATPATKLDVDGPIRAGSTGVTIGDACSPVGAMGYDSANDKSVYCSRTTGKWASQGLSACTPRAKVFGPGWWQQGGTSSCDAGETIAGGSADCEGQGEVTAFKSYQNGNGWYGYCWNDSGNGGGGNNAVHVTAICCH